MGIGHSRHPYNTRRRYHSAEPSLGHRTPHRHPAEPGHAQAQAQAQAHHTERGHAHAQAQAQGHHAEPGHAQAPALHAQIPISPHWCV